MKRTFSMFAISLGLLISSPSLAQFIRWQVPLPLERAPYHYSALALDGVGDTVVVAARIQDSARTEYRPIIQVSTDGGTNWLWIDPELSDKRGTHVIHSLQVLDALHFVAVTDSGFFLHTSDGGEHWASTLIGRRTFPWSIHFSSLKQGIVSCAGDTVLYITNDSGVTWLPHAIPSPGWGIRCASIGEGRFEMFSYGYGTLYTTSDFWQTYDSTLPLSPQGDMTHLPIDARLERGDEILAYGLKMIGLPYVNAPFMARSTNKGVDWDTITLPATALSTIEYVTSTDKDTLVALGDGAPEYLVSFDRGETWVRDTLAVDYPHGFRTGRMLYYSPTGHLVGIWKRQHVDPGEILVGRWQSAAVDRFERIVYSTHVYPNPATSYISVGSIDISQPVLVYDILGHEVLSGKLDGAGHAQFDVSQLPRGVYSVILKHDGVPLPIGKVAVVGR